MMFMLAKGTQDRYHFQLPQVFISSLALFYSCFMGLWLNTKVVKEHETPFHDNQKYARQFADVYEN